MEQTYSYNAKLIRVIDGDTVCLTLTKTFQNEIDFGFRIVETLTTEKSTTMNFRLARIDAPEIVGAKRETGLAAKAELERLLSLGHCRAMTYKPDKYGRWLVEIFVTTADGNEICVNDELVKSGHAKIYVI